MVGAGTSLRFNFFFIQSAAVKFVLSSYDHVSSIWAEEAVTNTCIKIDYLYYITYDAARPEPCLNTKYLIRPAPSS